MARFKKESIDRLLSTIDLASHAAKFMSLKKSGAEFVGCCLFHGEKSPSFRIYSDHHFYCYGCQAHGDVVSFEMKREGGNYPQALENLAAMYGFELEKTHLNDREDALAEQKKKDVHIIKEVVEAYHRNLFSADGKEALQYLLDRGYSNEQIVKWKLGWAPRKSVLAGMAINRGWNEKDLIALTLMQMSHKIGEENNSYDFFRARVMVPIKNDRGSFVAFGGRTLKQDGSEVKYVNSKETEYFKKSKTLFNLSDAAAAIRQKNRAIVVEGYMDCMTLVNAGFLNTVAVLGTALTIDHVKMLSKYCQEIVFCFDTDKSGQAACYKSFIVAFPLNLVTLLQISLPDGKDPDEFINKLPNGVNDFSLLLSNATSLTLFACQYLSAGLSTREARVRKIKEDLLPVILNNPDLAQREVALESVREFLGLSSLEALIPAKEAQKTTDSGAFRAQEFSQKNEPRTGIILNKSGIIANNKVVNASSSDGRIINGKKIDQLPDSQKISWTVKSANEFQFILALASCSDQMLPPRLSNLVMGLSSAEPMDESICAQTMSLFMSVDSKKIAEELLNLIFENRGMKPKTLASSFWGSCTLTTVAVLALASSNSEELEILGLEQWMQNSNIPNLVPLDVTNVFKPKNLSYFRFFYRDLELSERQGTLGIRLGKMLLDLELGFLENQKNEALTARGTLTEEKRSLQDLEFLDNRIKRISTEQIRREKQFFG